MKIVFKAQIVKYNTRMRKNIQQSIAPKSSSTNQRFTAGIQSAIQSIISFSANSHPGSVVPTTTNSPRQSIDKGRNARVVSNENTNSTLLQVATNLHRISEL